MSSLAVNLLLLILWSRGTELYIWYLLSNTWWCLGNVLSSLPGRCYQILFRLWGSHYLCIRLSFFLSWKPMLILLAPSLKDLFPDQTNLPFYLSNFTWNIKAAHGSCEIPGKIFWFWLTSKDKGQSGMSSSKIRCTVRFVFWNVRSL